MKVIINLKDTELIDIKTSITTGEFGDGSLAETVEISHVEFDFANGDKFVVKIGEIDLTCLLNFFYGEDFSNKTAYQLCDMFVNHVGVFNLKDWYSYRSFTDFENTEWRLLYFYYEKKTDSYYKYTIKNDTVYVKIVDSETFKREKNFYM